MFWSIEFLAIIFFISVPANKYWCTFTSNSRKFMYNWKWKFLLPENFWWFSAFYHLVIDICYCTINFVVCFLQTKNEKEKTKWMATLLHLIQKDLCSPTVCWWASITVFNYYVVCTMLHISVKDLCTCMCVCRLIDITMHWCHACTYLLMLLYLGLPLLLYSFIHPAYSSVSICVIPGWGVYCTQQLYVPPWSQICKH